MSKEKSLFSDIEDPELRKKLEDTLKSHSKKLQAVPPEVNQHPRFVFSRVTNNREPTNFVNVRNGLDEKPRGGEIIEKLGRAYLVQVGDDKLIVHEPDDSWEY